MYLDDIHLGDNIFYRKNVYLYDRPYVYYENIDELKTVLENFGATVQDKADEKTDIVVSSYFVETRHRPPFPDVPSEKVLSEDDFYKVLSALGVKGSRYRRILDEWPDSWHFYVFRHIAEQKQIALTENFYAYPSFEMKNVFLHGSFRKRRKTFARLLETQGGFLVDEFNEDTDIVVCGTDFSLEFLDHLEEIRKQRRLIVMSEETFFYQFDVLQYFKEEGVPGTRGSEETDRRELYRNELQYGAELEQKGNLRKALKIYEKCQRMNPPDYQPWCCIVDLYMRAKDYANGVVAIDRLLTLNLTNDLLSIEGTQYWERKRARFLVRIEKIEKAKKAEEKKAIKKLMVEEKSLMQIKGNTPKEPKVKKVKKAKKPNAAKKRQPRCPIVNRTYKLFAMKE